MPEEQAPAFQAPPSRDVFISYASQDAAAANEALEALEIRGITCWIAPRDVTPGAHYADAIISAISGAKAMVLVLSDSALVSKHVGKEIERASSKGRPIIALRTGTTPLPPTFEYFLSESQWIDCGHGGIHGVVAKLVEAVRSHLSQPVTVEPSAHSGPPMARPGAAPQRTNWMLAACAGILISVLAYLAVNNFWRGKPIAAQGPASGLASTADHAAPAVPEKSIAVLPFVDMSEKKDQEYFADGMAEEIIDLLAKIPNLRVPARTSSFYFKGKPTKIPDIARELGVAQVLEGSVRKSGNHLRVTAQLVRADNGYYLWSETYDRELHDVFKVQDEIANAVVQAMQIGLMGGVLTRPNGGTQNLEAYQLYLRALSAEGQNTEGTLIAGRGYLEKAIKLDPNFGLAWSLLAYNSVEQADFAMIPSETGFPRAKKEAQHALELSPDIAQAHSVLQYVYRTYDWDWAASEAEGRAALRLDPTNSRALMMSGLLDYTLGRPDEAVRKIRAALEHDPFLTYANFNLGAVLYSADRFAESEAVFRRLIEIEPGFSWTHAYLAKTLLAEGKPEEALATAQQEAEEINRLDILPIVLSATGKKAEADEALKTLIGKYASTESFFIAMNYAYRNEPDLALQWLDSASKHKDSALVEITGERLFNSLEGDPRFKAFLRKMNLPE